MMPRLGKGLSRIPVLVALATTVADAQTARSDTIVRWATSPRYAGVATLVREMTIGGADAAGENYEFDDIRGLLVARDGSIWIHDGRLMLRKLVRQFDSAGRFLRHIGRSGQGPGEWRSPDHVAQLPDGRVLLRDAVVPNPITVYHENGAYDTTLTFRHMVAQMRVDFSGILWLDFMIGGGMTMGAGGPWAYMRMRPDGSIIDTVPRLFMPPIAPKYVRIMSANGRTAGTVSPPYQPWGYMLWSPGGFVSATSGRYAINLHLTPARSSSTAPPAWRDGDPVLSIRRTLVPVSVTEEERRGQRRYMDAQISRANGTLSGPVPEVPRSKQLLKQLAIGADGRIWVGISQPSVRYTPPVPPPPPAGYAPLPARPPWTEPRLFDVYEPDGTYIGQVLVPFPIGIWFTHGDRVWAVEKDEDGIESVNRYRIQWKK